MTTRTDDLLAFQYAHFGDDTKPDNWFVSAEEALAFEQPEDDEADDDLGYYEDGTKRTLTDEQIAMFRHSEIEQLLRERRLQTEEDDYQNHEPEGVSEQPPASPASSLEGELVGLGRVKPKPAPKRKRKRKQQPPPQRERSGSVSSRSTSSMQRQRKKEIPYYERNKRKWEDYIDENDPVHGSMTHRRLVRELDTQRDEEVEVDYGEEVAPAAQSALEQAPPGRRAISYDED